MDIDGSLFLSKVSNQVLNENKDSDFTNSNIKIIASNKKQEGLTFINPILDKILWTYFTVFIGGFNTEALYSILLLLIDMKKDNSFNAEVMDVFNDFF